MRNKRLLALFLIIGGGSLALYFALAAFGCSGGQVVTGASACYTEFHTGTAIFVLSVAVAAFGIVIWNSD